MATAITTAGTMTITVMDMVDTVTAAMVTAAMDMVMVVMATAVMDTVDTDISPLHGLALLMKQA